MVWQYQDTAENCQRPEANEKAEFLRRLELFVRKANDQNAR
jgi:hypothetical protein